MALSSTEAKYSAAVSATQEVMHTRSLLESLGHKQEGPTVLRCDNQSAIAIAKNPVMHSRTRHIDVKLHFIRKAIEDNHVKVEYVATAENLADVLTKGLPRLKHEDHVVAMGLVQIPQKPAPANSESREKSKA